MKFLYDLAGGQTDTQLVNVHNGGSTPIAVGAAVMKGATVGTNGCFAVVAASALADIIGVLEAASSATDSNINGTANNFTQTCLNPMAVYLAEYDQTSVVTSTAASSGTTINCTGIENISGGWLYTVGGTGPGQLLYVVAGGVNTLTVKSAPTVAFDNTTTFIKILPNWKELIALNTAATALASQAGAGSGAGRVISSYMKYNGQDLVALDPTKHDGIIGLNTLNAHFYSAILFLDHALNVSA